MPERACELWSRSSRRAIAAVKDARPFNRRGCVLRATRSRSPIWAEPRYACRISPGWAGLCVVIGIDFLLTANGNPGSREKARRSECNAPFHFLP